MVNNVSLFRKRRLAFESIITGDRQLTSYSFGKFDFLPDERRLKKAGKEIPLGARAFDLLIFLVENRHRVVTKAEMLDAVWPDIAVEESNLTVQVSALRKALGADALATIPGRGYQFVLAESAAEAKGPDSKSKPGSSILVLPFANTSNDPDQEYFSDGISEDIITDLCKVRALSVIARNTAFTFKGRAVDVAEIAGRLGVSHVVEGSVRKAGNRLRINAQLVDGATGHPVWAERFDRDLTDIFALQDEIAQAIVAALKVRLIPDERAAILARPTDNPEAYEIYLQARHHHYRLSQQDYQIAARLAKQAIEIDPKYERAWALLAVSQAWLSTLEGGTTAGWQRPNGRLSSIQSQPRLWPPNPGSLLAWAVGMTHWRSQKDHCSLIPSPMTFASMPGATIFWPDAKRKRSSCWSARRHTLLMPCRPCPLWGWPTRRPVKRAKQLKLRNGRSSAQIAPWSATIPMFTR